MKGGFEKFFTRQGGTSNNFSLIEGGALEK